MSRDLLLTSLIHFLYLSLPTSLALSISLSLFSVYIFVFCHDRSHSSHTRIHIVQLFLPFSFITSSFGVGQQQQQIKMEAYTVSHFFISSYRARRPCTLSSPISTFCVRRRLKMSFIHRDNEERTQTTEAQ